MISQICIVRGYVLARGGYWRHRLPYAARPHRDSALNGEVGGSGIRIVLCCTPHGML